MTKQTPYDDFLEAQRQTEVIRQRKNLLYTFGTTRLPYVFLGNSSVNPGDVVVRSGEVCAERPQIVTSSSATEFEGFGFEEMEGDDRSAVIPVLLSRLIHFPPARYSNSHGSMEVVNGPLEKAVECAVNRLDRQNDIRTAVITGNESMWGYSLLGYAGQMIAKSAASNIGEYFEHFGQPSL